jgi:hypothetical protein
MFKRVFYYLCSKVKIAYRNPITGKFSYPIQVSRYSAKDKKTTISYDITWVRNPLTGNIVDKPCKPKRS